MNRLRRRTAAALGLALAAASFSGCSGRDRVEGSGGPKAVALDRPAVVEIDLARGISESSPATLFGPSSRRTHGELVRSLRGLVEAESSKGFLVRLGTARIAFARAHEVGRILGEARKAGRPVVCHADDYNNGTLLLAAVACSKLFVSPAGQVDTVGIAAQLIFAKGLLDKLHVDVDFLQVGKFKGASEPFTRETASPEARKSLETALGGLRTAWLAGIADGRGKQELRDLVEDGPFPAQEAKAKGLVDEVGDLEDAREDAKKLAETDVSVTRFGGELDREPSVSRGLVDLFRAISGASAVGTPHVAVIPAVGSISMSAGGSPLGGGDGIGERELGRVLTRLAKDPSVKAVVLRIDSPGGSALASDLLWKRLMRLRKEKPIVVSVGSMAASGGYYMACAGSKIFAEPTSIIGSIGVVGGKLAVGKTLAEVGINAETVAANPDPKRASRASYMSPLTPWDDATREKMSSVIHSMYDLFLQRIAEGRGATVEAIAPSAEGRLFGGAEAKERGLVDELGGLEDAVKLARQLGELPADAPVEIEEDDGGLLALLVGDEIVEGETDAPRQRAGEALEEQARRSATRALLPDWLETPEIGAFVGSVAPILAGERTLAALPFVVVIR